MAEGHRRHAAALAPPERPEVLGLCRLEAVRCERHSLCAAHRPERQNHCPQPARRGAGRQAGRRVRHDGTGQGCELQRRQDLQRGSGAGQEGGQARVRGLLHLVVRSLQDDGQQGVPQEGGRRLLQQEVCVLEGGHGEGRGRRTGQALRRECLPNLPHPRR